MSPGKQIELKNRTEGKLSPVWFKRTLQGKGERMRHGVQIKKARENHCKKRWKMTCNG